MIGYIVDIGNGDGAQSNADYFQVAIESFKFSNCI